MSSYYNKCINILRSLNKQFPSMGIGRHIITATDGMDLWGISDKELFFCLERYKLEMEMDIPHMYIEKDIDKIIEDGLHLERVLYEEDE